MRKKSEILIDQPATRNDASNSNRFLGFFFCSFYFLGAFSAGKLGKHGEMLKLRKCNCFGECIVQERGNLHA